MNTTRRAFSAILPAAAAGLAFAQKSDTADLVPIAVVDRVGPSLYATAGTAGQALSRFRIPETAATSLAYRRPPVWVFLHGLKSPLSSTALRALRGKSARA